MQALQPDLRSPEVAAINPPRPSRLSLEAQDIWVKRGRRMILRGVSFTADPGSFVAVVGPNGAGKTTLFNALCGARPDRGRVLIDGHSFYDRPQYWLSRIGYVPVGNTLHSHLTVFEALRYTTLLRVAGIGPDDAAQLVDNLLTQFDFSAQDKRRDHLIKNLSSGELKRVNICAELVTNPGLLFLDEPTSNLDPDAEVNLMQRLGQLAHDQGKTVVIITHTLATLDECDKVVFVENGAIRAIGTPTAVRDELEAGEPDPKTGDSDMYRWAAIFEKYRTVDVTDSDPNDTLTHLPVAANPSLASGPWTRPQYPAHNGIRHFKLLLQRYWLTRRHDWPSLLVILALGLVGGIFLIVLPAQAFVKPDNGSDIPVHIVTARQSVFLLATIIVLTGLIASFREMSKEYAIIRHERLKGISPLAVVCSKFVLLALTVGLLAPVEILLMLFLVERQEIPYLTLPPSLVLASYLVVLSLACIASIALGLAISALAGDDNLATSLLACVVTFQVLLSGLVKNQLIDGLINGVSLLATTRWAVEGLSSSSAFYCWSSVKLFSEYDSPGHIAAICLFLVAYAGIAVGLGAIALRLRDPWLSITERFPSLRPDLLRSVPVAFLLLAIVSWGISLWGQSAAFERLTFFDNDFGGIRFASVSAVQGVTFAQEINGYLSQSRCGS